MAAPRHIKPDTLKVFTQWLRDQGADVLSPLNQWELLRFVANGQTSILYTQKSGRLTWTGETEKAWDCFKNRGKWSPGPKTKKRPEGMQRAQYLEALVARDGQTCWFCGCLLDWLEMTIEHLVSKSVGGPNHLDNFVLACEPCNSEAHTMSVAEKVTLRSSKSGVTSGQITRAQAARIAREFSHPAHGPSLREDIAKAIEEHESGG